MRVYWTPRAAENFHDLAERLNEFSTGAGDRLVDQVTERLTQLETFPESGRVVPEFEERIVRELLEGDYRVIYERFATGSKSSPSFMDHAACAKANRHTAVTSRSRHPLTARAVPTTIAP